MALAMLHAAFICVSCSACMQDSGPEATCCLCWVCWLCLILKHQQPDHAPQDASASSLLAVTGIGHLCNRLCSIYLAWAPPAPPPRPQVLGEVGTSSSPASCVGLILCVHCQTKAHGLLLLLLLHAVTLFAYHAVRQTCIVHRTLPSLHSGKLCELQG